MSDAVPALGAIERLRLYYSKNEQRIAVLSFICGFLFDILMVDRADSWHAIAQQLVYLAVILAALTQMFFEEAAPAPDPGTRMRLVRWYYQYRTALVHFFLGTLLNVYTIFFFKSSSLLVSFGFLAFLVFLLWANESERMKSMGLPFKFTLLALCSLCFAANVVPIFVGSIGLAVFLVSMLAGCVPVAGVAWWIRRRAPDLFPRARRQMLVPLGGVLVGFLVFYWLRLIPPVPLSIPFIGVYHAVEKSGDDYRLSHERPIWRIWQHGDQEFLAQPGDRIYVFFRIFSPTRFSDQVQMRWYWEDGERGWVLQDTIPIKIVGGRAEGFRGYGFKSNYQPGEWKVQVGTTDNREIGRVYFTLETRPQWPRTFEIEIQ
ncbi:MAG TPA: DUF2914 domain-containing protein [Burkholderiales bacterium]|nr:DUF2914 domain-containing protein [Burkholderiales bacterium]